MPDPRPSHPLPSPHESSRARRLLHLLQCGLQRTGLAAAYAGLTRASGAAVLCYHSVPSPELEGWIDPRFAHPKRTFAAQMRFLREHRNPVSLATVQAALAEGRSLPRGSVAVTFDDGYLDNFTEARPVLEELEIPATVFLATSYIGDCRSQWVDELYGHFFHRSRHQLKTPAGEFELQRQGETDAAYTAIADQLLASDYAQRQQQLESIRDQLAPSGVPPRRTMNWSEAAALAAHPLFEIGGHSAHHIDLATGRPADIAAEIDECLDDLRKHLQLEARLFSYPYGRLSEEVVEILRARSIELAVAVEPPGLVTPACDPLQLPRIEAPQDLCSLAYMTSGAYPRMSEALFHRS